MRMFIAEHPPPSRQRLGHQGFRRRPLALVKEGGGEIVQGAQGVGVLGTEMAAAQRQNLLLKHPRPGVIPLRPQRPRQIVYGGQGVGVLGTEMAAAQRQPLLL